MGIPIALVCAGLVAGCALQLLQPGLWPATAYASLVPVAVAALAAGLAFAQAMVRKVAIAACVITFAFAATGFRAALFQSHALAPALEGRDLVLSGVVAGMPQQGEGGTRFRFEVESARAGGTPVRVPPLLSLGWWGAGAFAREPGDPAPASVPLLRAGERWQFTARLKAPHGNVNPHGFDYELWLWEQGIQATGSVRAGPRDSPAVRLAGTWRHPIERARQAVRDAVFERVADRRTAGVLAALVAGDQNAIDRADWDVFRATGVAHLMSISGLHITMFAWAAAAVIGRLWRRSARLCMAWPAQHAALAGGIALAGLYALFSGWGVPAQRTVCMLATVGLLRLSGRRWPWPHVWLLACAVVVMADPWALLQAGFWLSFVAVGVLFAADPQPPKPSPATQHDSTWRARAARFAASLRSAWHEQWVVTLALTPLSLLLFGQVSVVGLAANALAIPWVTLVVTPLAMLGVLLPDAWTAAAWTVPALAAWLGWLAAWPWATLASPAPAAWAVMAGVAGGVLLAMRLPWTLRVLGLPMLLPAFLWQVPRPAAGTFELWAADVGQGNALIVRTAAHTLVYDAGPRWGPESDAGHRVLVPMLRASGEEVDTLVLSHRDLDHTGGAAAVLAMQPHASLVSSIEATHELQALRPAWRCTAGQRWQWDGVDFEMLHPLAGDYDRAARSNAMSCVLRISAGGHAALLAGDVEQREEARLVESGALAPVDLLLVPHHGSKTSSSDPFLEALDPSVAIVQAGYRNRFGHPAPAVMERYGDRGIRVYASPACGAALWRSSAPQAVQCQRDVQRRYWHHAPTAR